MLWVNVIPWLPFLAILLVNRIVYNFQEKNLFMYFWR